MNTYTFHINLYDLAFLGAIITGLNFAWLLWFTKQANQNANRFLSLALLTMVLWVTWLLGVDTGLENYFPHWNRVPLQLSLALGPFIYFYISKLSRPQYKFHWKDCLHFMPVLSQQLVLTLQAGKGISPVLQLATFISVAIYLYLSFRLIESFYQTIEFNDLSDRCRYELQWLQSILKRFSLIWLLWIPYTATDYFSYHHLLGLHPYYSLFFVLLLTMIWMANKAFSQPGPALQPPTSPLPKSSAPAALKQKGVWLKRAMETEMFYRDADLTLTSLAERLEIHHHELSRIINVALKKNFNDFINEYR